MAYLNLQAVIDYYHIDHEIIALLLFPENKFPKTALNRILSEESYLTSEQVYILADFLGINITELYIFGPKWIQQSSKIANTVILKKGKYTVHINTHSGIMIVYEQSKPIDYLKILTDTSIKLNDLFEIIDTHILNYF